MTSRPLPLLVEAAVVGTLLAGLAEGARLATFGAGAALAGLGLWAPLLPAVFVGLVAAALIARAAPLRALATPDGPAWSAAALILLGGALAGLGFGAGRLAGRAVAILKEITLIDPVLAVGTIGLGLGATVLALIVIGPLARLLGRLTPGRRIAVTLALGAGPLATVLALGARPLLRGSSSWPGVLAAIALGGAIAWALLARRLLPERPPTRRRSAIAVGALALVGLLGVIAYGNSVDARGAVDDSRGVARPLARMLTTLADRDGDGFAGLIGGDCDDGDPEINPLAIDRPGNGVDEDCDGADRTSTAREAAPVTHHPVPPALRDRPLNVLLISVDTVRADRMSLYGHDRPTSPRIDALGARSVVFERAYPAANQTRHALPTMHAGRHIDFMRTDRRSTSVLFVEGNHLLFERLKAAGLATEAHLSHYFNHYLHLGLGQGIDRVVDVKQKVRSPLSAPTITDNAIAGLDRHRGERWAMWVHYTEPHAPYQAHDGIHFGDDPIDRYDGEILRVDREIGRLLDALDRRGLTDSTVIVITSDHGEEFGEHGREFHGKQLYEESIRVPLLIAAPGLPPARIPEPVSQIDLAHTVANLLGLPPAPGYGALSLVDRMLGAAGDPERTLFVDCIWHDDRPAERQLAVIEGQWKLIYDVRNGRVRLYDLAADPGETRSVHREHGARTARMRAAAREQITRYQETTLEQLLERRVADRAPPDLPGPKQVIAPGLRLHGARIERVSPHLPMYGARVWLEAEGDTRPDYVLRFEWFDGAERKVARRDVRPLAGRYPTHRWQAGEVVEAVMRTRIQRGRRPYRVDLTVLDGDAPITPPLTLGRVAR